MKSLIIPLFSNLWYIQLIVNVLIIAGMIVIGLVLPGNRKKIFADWMSFTIFFLLFFSQLYLAVLDIWNVGVLPLEFCSFMFMVAGVALYTRSQAFYELSLFLGIFPPMMAFIFPAIYMGSDPLIVLFYYLSHCLTIGAPIYLTFVLGMRPRVLSWCKSVRNMSCIVPVVMTSNFALGTNYMFLSDRPPVAEAITFGCWPYYFFIWVAAILVANFLLSCCLKKHPL